MKTARTLMVLMAAAGLCLSLGLTGCKKAAVERTSTEQQVDQQLADFLERHNPTIAGVHRLRYANTCDSEEKSIQMCASAALFKAAGVWLHCWEKYQSADILLP